MIALEKERWGEGRGEEGERRRRGERETEVGTHGTETSGREGNFTCKKDSLSRVTHNKNLKNITFNFNSNRN